jgi:S-formylglutathione hydrolase FrmB
MSRPLVVRRAVVAAVLLSGGGFVGVHASAAGDPPIVQAGTPVAALAPAPPLRLLSSTKKGRLTELHFSTPYLKGPVGVRVLTPVGYGTDPHRRWPVLWLLHGIYTKHTGTSADDVEGGGPGYAQWTDYCAAEALTRKGRFLVVMPEAGIGQYADNYGVAGEGGPKWESFHLQQLLPWIDAHYRTIPTRAARAVAGLSMGGGGAMRYAARRPDLFSYAASYSGAVDPTDGQPLMGARATDINQALMPISGDGDLPESAFGPWATEEIRTRAHGAVDLVGNLRETVLILRTADGTDESGVITSPDEWGVHGQTVNLHQALDRAGIPHTFEDAGHGAHTWSRFEDGLRREIAPLNAFFASGGRRAPGSFSFTWAEERADMYGYRVVSDRGFLEFATMHVRTDRLLLSGSGIFRITTAARYVPGARYRLTATRVARTQQALVRADNSGRLSFSVDTGVRSTGQQYRPDPGVTTHVNQVQLTIQRT